MPIPSCRAAHALTYPILLRYTSTFLMQRPQKHVRGVDSTRLWRSSDQKTKKRHNRILVVVVYCRRRSTFVQRLWGVILTHVLVFWHARIWIAVSPVDITQWWLDREIPLTVGNSIAVVTSIDSPDMRRHNLLDHKLLDLKWLWREGGNLEIRNK